MPRKISHLRRTSAGFTLIEVLVIIAILVVLAVIVIGVLPGPGIGDLKQTRVTMKNIALKLEEYASEHQGIYPVGEDGSSTVLYQVLSGDPTGEGKEPTRPVYWEELNNHKNPALVGTLNSKKVILDGFGETFRYRSAFDQNQNPVDGVKNTENFDLWSTGPDGKPSELSTPGTFESEETKDDLWR